MMFELRWKDLKEMIGAPVAICFTSAPGFSKWVLIEKRCDDGFGKAYACVDAHGMRYMLRKFVVQEGLIRVYDRFTCLHKDAEVQGEEDND